MTQDTLHANGKFVLLEKLSLDHGIITELDQSMVASKDAIVCDDNHVVKGFTKVYSANRERYCQGDPSA
jgi:precorrin isomerase